jgi:glyoxylase-like metal-dependent hydrolase (beta-lactamase superfamily II)
VGLGAWLAGGCSLLAAGVWGLARSRETLLPVREIRANLYAARGGGGVFAYGLRVDSSVLLFDAGADPEGHPLRMLVTALHGTPADLRGLWLTNARPDHRAGASAAGFRETPVFVGAGDAAVLDGRTSPSDLRGRILAMVWPLPPRPTARALAQSELWTFGEGPTRHVLRAWPTPGPTPGSTSYLIDDVLFVGDLLTWHEGRLALPTGLLGEEAAQARRSLRFLADELAHVELGLVCTGHGGCTPEGTAARAWAQVLAARPAL